MTQELMDEAESVPSSAQLLFEARDSDGATNRAYYAMFTGRSATRPFAHVHDDNDLPPRFCDRLDLVLV